MVNFRTYSIGSKYHKPAESRQKQRKEIKISLVEGMAYDETGKDMGIGNMGNAKFIELNYRKRAINEIQDKTDGINDDSMRTFKEHYNHKDESSDGSESDYVARFIEQAAAVSGINPSSVLYQESSPIRRKVNTQSRQKDIIKQKTADNSPQNNKKHIHFKELRNLMGKSLSFIHKNESEEMKFGVRTKSMYEERDPLTFRPNAQSLFQNSSVESRLNNKLVIIINKYLEKSQH